MTNNKKSENWTDVHPNFTKELTQQWINEGFDKDEVKNWLEIKPNLINCSAFFAWFRDEMEMESSEIIELSNDEFETLFDQFQQWIKNFIWCNECKKRIEREKALLSDSNEKIDFCSQECKNDSKKMNSPKESKNHADENYVNAQEWLDNNYPENSFCRNSEDEENRGKKRNEITNLYINEKNLKGKLNLREFTNLKRFFCSKNYLTNLELSWSSEIEFLDISNNNFAEQDLSFLSHLVKLEFLLLGNEDKKKDQNIYNRFNGSFRPLKDMKNLTVLSVVGTNIDGGLKYLPESLVSFWHTSKKIGKELFPYGGNLKAWKEDQKKSNDSNRKENLVVITHASEKLYSEKKSKEKENYDFDNIKYQEITLRDKHLFSWEREKGQPQSNLPTKLYHIPTNTVIHTKNNVDIKNYAIMSYVWGDLSDKSNLITWDYNYQNEKGETETKQIGVSLENNATGAPKQSIKSLKKAIEACRLIGIDYLWMDQMCIDQFNNQEANEEVPKMRQYYGNAEVTLVSINKKVKDIEIKKEGHQGVFEDLIVSGEILEKIVNSEWFNRSWTFQEGLLSEQTLFMFDDCLVDGRTMAQVWANHFQEERGIENTNKPNNEVRRFITPFGWTYRWKFNKNKKELDLKEAVNLTLSQALASIKLRSRSIPIDGLYSILGLLPYGEEVKTRYKKWGETYTEAELRENLLELIKVGVANGYAEPLTWFGPRVNEPNLWWMPKINEEGTVNIMGTKKFTDCNLANIKFTDCTVSLIGCKCQIHSLQQVFNTMGESFDFFPDSKKDSFGELTTSIRIQNLLTQFKAYGLRETLEKIKEGDNLIIPRGQELEENNLGSLKFYKVFAILVPSKGNLNCPIDMLELTINGQAFEILKQDAELSINVINKTITETKLSTNAQEWINQVYPKEARNKIKKLDINDRNLTGHLDLSDFTNLEELDCSDNLITCLDLSGCNNLVSLKAHLNNLTDIDFLKELPNPQILKDLCLSGNNLGGDLLPFSCFVNLEDLDLGMSRFSEEIIEKRGNEFTGSLRPLNCLHSLKKLDISNTNISSGLEYLPRGLKEIYCAFKERPKSRVRSIAEQLSSCLIDDSCGKYDFTLWNYNSSLLARIEEKELKRLINRLRIDWKIIQGLQNKYRELLVGLESDVNVQKIYEDIEMISKSISNLGTRKEDIQQICELCMAIAELNLKQETQQQFEIEIPPK